MIYLDSVTATGKKSCYEVYNVIFKILDSDGNAINGATITAVDVNGDTILKKNVGNVTTQVAYADTTIAMDDTSELVANDYIKINAEWLKVVSVDSSTQITVSRDQRGTYRPKSGQWHRRFRDKPVYKEVQSLTSDSEGLIENQKIIRTKYYYDPTKTGNGTWATKGIKDDYYPWTITVSKDGYQTVVIETSAITGPYEENNPFIITFKPAIIQTDQEMAIQI